MRVWLWVPQLIVSVPSRNSFATYLAVPLGSRVQFHTVSSAMMVRGVDSEVATLYTSLCSELGLPLLAPAIDIQQLPKLTQFVLCMQASLNVVSRATRDLVRLAMMESAMLEVDPGVVLALHCCAKYGTPCVARLDEFVRPTLRVSLKLKIEEVEGFGGTSLLIDRDLALRNLVNKMVSHIVASVVNSERCSDVLEYLRFASVVSQGLVGKSAAVNDMLRIVSPWIAGLVEIVSLGVECHEASSS